MNERIFTEAQLKELAARMLRTSGMKDEDAATIAKDLVAADMRGLYSHGVSRIPMYLKRIDCKCVKPVPDIKVEQVGAAVLRVNGDVSSLYYRFDEPQNLGHIMFIFRPDMFVSLDEYKKRMDVYYKRLKALPRAADFDEILMPGEPEDRKTEAARKNGISLSGNIQESLYKCNLSKHCFLDSLPC